MTPITQHTPEELFDRFQQRMQKHMREHWKAYLLEGLVLTAIGSAAVVMPNIATLAADEMIGWLLMVAGLSVIIARLTRHESPDVWQGVLFGGLTAILGGLIAFYPASGVVTLTMPAARSVAKENGAAFFDGTARWRAQAQPGDLGDGLHPANASAARIIVPALTTFLGAAYGKDC